MPQYITLTDFILLPFVFLIIYKIALYLRNKHLPKGNPLRPYFVPALLLKVLGAVAFAMVYNFYYGYGDTFYYYNMGTFFTKVLIDNPFDFLKVYILPPDQYFIPKSFTYNFDYLYNHYPATVAVARFSSFFGLFSFNNYLLINICFSILSFTGLWKLFRMFSAIEKDSIKPLAYIILFMPSVIFWGSGLLKDSLTIGAVGWLCFSCWRLFSEKSYIQSSVLIMIVSLLIIYTLKSYILICFIPAIIIWIISLYYRNIRNRNYRLLIWAGFICLLIILVYNSDILLDFQKKQFQQLAATAFSINSSLQGYEAGSSYKLPISNSLSELIATSPIAVGTTLYRPFLWEAHTVTMLISALESFLIILLTIYVIYKLGIGRFFKSTFSDGLVFFCFAFAVSFSIGIAITSENFGTLVRYKLPAVIFYLVGLSLVYYKYKKPVMGFSKEKQLLKQSGISFS